MPRVTQQISGKAESWNQVAQDQSPSLNHLINLTCVVFKTGCRPDLAHRQLLADPSPRLGILKRFRLRTLL